MARGTKEASRQEREGKRFKTKKTLSASYSVTFRIEYPNRTGAVGKILTTIGEAGGDSGAVDIVE